MKITDYKVKGCIYGLIGSLLLLISSFPYVGLIGLIFSIILLTISFKKFSKVFNDKNLFKSYILGIVFYTLGTLILIFGIISTIIVNIGIILKSLLDMDILHLINIFIWLIITLGALLLIYGIFMTISGVYFDKSFNLLSKYSKISLFKYCGIFYLVGGLLSVIGIGYILITIGKIIQILGFSYMAYLIYKKEF